MTVKVRISWFFKGSHKSMSQRVYKAVNVILSVFKSVRVYFFCFWQKLLKQYNFLSQLER